MERSRVTLHRYSHDNGGCILDAPRVIIRYTTSMSKGIADWSVIVHRAHPWNEVALGSMDRFPSLLVAWRAT